ncbi:MAG: Gfo/Idh/MocA family oxidoreductase [Candidatus Poribacteria bacterium]|nr:Gfo/Idh/MocA family oxidoreductase [Candidatus Poribacteria bacterium]
MRLVVLSFSHHGRSLGRVGRELGHEIVGVMDGDEAPRRQLEREFQCPGFDTAGACLDASKPDAALVAGKHIEMPSHIQACVDRRIPYLLDKPFADCAARLRPAAEASEKHGVFSALVLPNRASRIVDAVKEMVADGTLGELVMYNSRLNNGPPSRYDPTPSAWHNRPDVSGGGCWAVEAAHGIDTFLQFVGNRHVTVVGAVMSNAMYHRGVEDIGVGVLRTDDGVTGIIESGYSYPAGVRSGDHFFRFVGTKASVFEQYGKNGEPLIEVHTAEGIRFSEDISHGERMQGIISEALSAIHDGRAFEPTVVDAVRVLEIQDAVYEHARRGTATNGPHPMGAPAPRP